MILKIGTSPNPGYYTQAFEFVERKGIGHPDTLCDAIAERASRYYSRYCLEQFGRLAHHWFDKVILIGGEATLAFGYGELTRPYHVIFCGKAVTKVADQHLPINDILTQAAADVLVETLYAFDPHLNLTIENHISSGCGPGQQSDRYRPLNAQELYLPGEPGLVSNDCNLCIGYASSSVLECLVLECEHWVNSREFKADNPDTGSDVKVVGCRTGEQFNLTVNMPFIANFILSNNMYFQRVEQVELILREHLKNFTLLPVTLTLNPEKTHGRVYLTAKGSVADTGDVGVVGRGNRANGLITPMRPMSIEASAGKNPLDHTGKIYTVLSNQIASDIYTHWGINNVVGLSTVKGRLVSDPEYTFVELGGSQDAALPSLDDINAVVAARLEATSSMWQTFVNEGIVLW